MTARRPSLGPWTTALDNGSQLELSAFWKRRMRSLAELPRASRRLRRRVLAGALAAAALLAATPLVDFSPADAAGQADEPTAVDENPGPAGKFLARFSNGVEIELIGVSSTPSALESWRTPDGQPLVAPYFSLHPLRNTWNSPMLREVCWRWRGVDSPDIHTSWDVEEDTHGWGPVQPGDADGKLIKDLTAFVVPFTVIRPSCTLRFTMSHPVSEWEEYWQGQGGHVSSFASHPPGQDVSGVTFDKPRSMDGGTFVVMVYRFGNDQDARLIAVDSDGKHHVGNGESGGNLMGFRQLAVRFPDLKPEHIRDYIVERRTRKFEFVMFRNVSLDPATPTLVQMVGPAVEASDGRTAGADPPQAAVEENGADSGYGPVVEVTLYDERKREDCYFDFDSSKIVARPDPQGREELEAWTVENGVDVAAGVSEHFAGLLGLDMIAFPAVRPTDWDNPASQLKRLERGKPGTPIPMAAGGKLPATFCFQTREGARGVLQIVEVIPDEAVRIRYKLVKPPGGQD